VLRKRGHDFCRLSTDSNLISTIFDRGRKFRGGALQFFGFIFNFVADFLRSEAESPVGLEA